VNLGLGAITALVADDAPRNTGPDFGKASPVGLLIVVLLLIGTVLLVRSMNRHLRKLPETFDRNNPQPDDRAGPDPSAGIADIDTDGHTPSEQTDNRGQSGEPSG
jgi:hypothetical protein